MTQSQPHFPATLRLFFLFLFAAVTAYGQISQEQQDFAYGERLYREGLFELSAIQFEAFPNRYPTSPKSPDAQWMAADSFFRLKRFDEAREAFLRYMLRYPDAKNQDLAQFRMAECFERSGRTAAACQSYRQIQLMHPKSRWAGEGLLRSAALAVRSDSLESAEPLLRAVLESADYPESRSRAAFLLSEILMKRHRPDEAVDILQPIAARPARDPDRFEASLRLGSIYSEIGDWIPAMTQFRALMASPGVPDSLRRVAGFRLGRIEALTGEHEDACQSFESVLAAGAEPVDGEDVRWWLGLSQSASGRPSDALKSFQNVDPAGVRGPAAGFEAAMGLLRMDRPDEAEAEFLRLTEQAPPVRPLSMLGLAYAQTLRGADAEASASYSRFLLEFPDNPCADRVLLRKAVIDLDRTGRPEEAFGSMEKLWNLFPASPCVPESQFLYARGLARLGRVREACLLLRRVIADRPFSAWADSSVVLLERIEWTNPLQGAGLAGRLAPILNASLGSPSPEFQYTLGLFCFESLKDYPASQSCFLSWLKTATDSARADSARFMIADGWFRRSVLEHNPPLADSALAILEPLNSLPQAHPLRVGVRMLRHRIATVRGAGDAGRWISDLPPSCVTDPTEAVRLVSLARSALAIDSIEAAERLLALLPADGGRDGNMESAGAAALLRALIEKRRGRIDAADSLFSRIADSGFPPSIRSASSWFLALSAESSGNIRKAVPLYRAAAAHPFSLVSADSVLLRLGDALLASGEPDRAALIFEEALSSDSVSASCSRLGLGNGHPALRPALLSRLADAYRAAARTGPARSALIRYGAAETGPAGRRNLWAGLASLAETEGQKQTARFFLSRRAAADSSAEGLAELADLDFRLGRFADAADGYSRAAERTGNESRKAVLTAGRIVSLFRLDRLADGESGRKAFESRFKGDPSFKELRAQIRLEQGMALSREKSFEAAIDCFEDAADSRNPSLSLKAELERGRALLLMNRTDKGLGLMTDLIRRSADDPILPEIYLVLGEHYLRSGQTDNALAAFKKAMADSLSPEIHRKAATQCIRLYEGLQMTDAAIALTKRYLERFPGAEDAFAKKIRLGIYYYELKEFGRAVAQLRSLQPEADPRDEAEIQYWIGKCYAEMGRFDEAIFEFLKVKYLCPPTQLPWAATALYEAGMAYLRLQRPDSARQMFTRIVQSEGVTSDLGRIAKQRADAIESTASEPAL
ncbi:MAG: tetratricopeptide repeat protein [bacterium]|nr:tetratricopeptide repeat protein [bacterium]